MNGHQSDWPRFRQVGAQLHPLWQAAFKMTEDLPLMQPQNSSPPLPGYVRLRGRKVPPTHQSYPVFQEILRRLDEAQLQDMRAKYGSNVDLPEGNPGAANPHAFDVARLIMNNLNPTGITSRQFAGQPMKWITSEV